MAQIADLVDEFGRPILDGDEIPEPVYAHFAAALLASLPSGQVWPRDQYAVMPKAVATLAPTFYRISQRAAYLLKESPAGDSLLELLPEWENTLGLPDQCSGPEATIALRQQAVRAKIAARGGQSVPYFVAIAAHLGFTITVTEFAPSRFGAPFGAPFVEADAAHIWQVNAPGTLLFPFIFGDGRFGDPFGSYGSTLLYCTLNRIKPAHTILLIAYS